MGLLTWVMTISAATCADLAGRVKATELSIAYLCFIVTLIGLFAVILNLQNAFVASYRNGGSSSISLPPSRSSEIKGQARKVNDSLYALHQPLATPPSAQIVLFHGLQTGDYSDAHWSTWLSEDGSCMWPNTWLAEEIPGVHVFSVCYSGDMYIIGENLLSDLLQGEIGQQSYCPVILVGHSIGGLVIKQLCQQAHDRLHIVQGFEKAKYEAFLRNIKGIFFYSTPHRGSQIAKMLTKRIPRPLFKYFETLSTDTARLNYRFDGLCKVHDSWMIAGLSEGLPTNLGLFKYFCEYYVVPEASARTGDFNVVNGADHFSICKPRDKSSRSFYKLKNFVQRISRDVQDTKMRDIHLQEEARAQENSRPKGLQYVPKYVIGLDSQVEQITGKLDKIKTLGLVGMGGLGKTTLAKEVFNRLAQNFEYSCFIPDVKLIVGAKDTIIAKIEETTDRVRWRTKPLLLVLDDIAGERDEKVLSEIEDTTATESRIIFTTRNQHPLGYLGEVYKVDFLNDTIAKRLFLSYAFLDHKEPPTKFKWLVDAIVQKCGGLPLALEVLGQYLRTVKSYEVWEETLHALGKAEDLSDVNERLWEKLRLSYDGLEEKVQQIFLDATTFFSVNRGMEPWTLHEAKAVWQVAYKTHGALLWQKLVNMSLVYDVEEDECIRVHEQLQSMGRKIASESINNNRHRAWDGDEGLKLIQNKKELHEQEIFALRLGRAYDLRKTDITSTSLSSLKNLRYLEVNLQKLVDAPQGSLPFQKNLVLLDCMASRISHVLLHSALGANLVVLKLSWSKSCLPSCIGSFSTLRFFTLHFAPRLKSLPDEIGNLSQLEVMKIIMSHKLKTLPESFGNLSALNHLAFRSCERIQTLPESFGNLSALNHLTFTSCEQLQALPESFGNLSSLHHLEFSSCPQLQALPECFGNLSTLHHLEFSSCPQLQALPECFGNLSTLHHLNFTVCRRLQSLSESFGNLSALNHLNFSCCDRLQSLPESFGNLSALTHLTFYVCNQLHTLPESFGNLSALNRLQFWVCKQLQALPESFGSLSALNSLDVNSSDQLQTLPESFGTLSALNYFSLNNCPQFQALPNSFGNLSALNYLEIRLCGKLEILPNSFGNLSGLKTLVLNTCEQLQTLPESVGNLSALKHLRVYECDQLITLPESFGNLSGLNRLEFDTCRKLLTLPKSFTQLSGLNYLEFTRCDNLKELLEFLPGALPIDPANIIFREEEKSCLKSPGELSPSTQQTSYSAKRRRVARIPSSSSGELSPLTQRTSYSAKRRRVARIPSSSSGELSPLTQRTSYSAKRRNGRS